MPNFKEFSFGFGPSFFLIKSVHFQPRQDKMIVCSFTKPSSCIKVENEHFYPIKEGPTLKPSSLRVGTCQGQNYFTLVHQTLFWNKPCWMCVASTWEAMGFSLNLLGEGWVISIASKVEGFETNTPPKTNTYKSLPIANTLLSWTVLHGVRVLGPMGWHF